MAAISASLLAAAAATSSAARLLTPAATPSSTTPTLPTTDAAQSALVTGFAGLLSAASGETAISQGTTDESDTTDATDTTTGSDAAAALAVLGLIPPPLPTPVELTGTGVTPAPTVPTGVDGTRPILVLEGFTPPASPTDTTSRSTELARSTAPAAQTLPPPVPTLPVADAAEPTPPADPTTVATTALPGVHTTTVAATPAELTAAAARPPAVLPQTPVVIDRGQQLPPQPAELGYAGVGPVVAELPAVNPVPAVGGTPSQAQVEQRVASLPAFATTGSAEASGPPAPVDQPAPAQPFSQVLADQSATAVPVQPGQPNGTPAVARANPWAETADPATPSPTVAESPVAPSRPAVASAPSAESPSTVLPAPAVPPGLRVAEVIDTPTDRGEFDPSATVVSGRPTAQTPDPTPAAPQRPAPTPTPAAQVSEAFLTHTRLTEKGGVHEFQLRLDPPELGEVKVRVLAMGDRVEARLVVSDDAVKRLIESQLPELRQRLEAAGVNVPSFDVSTDAGGRGGAGDRWDQPQNTGRASPAPYRAGTTPAPAAAAARTASSGGRLDVTA